MALDSHTDSSGGGWAERFSGVLCLLALLLTLLLPLKFGSTTGLPEVANFPGALLEWVIFIWPPILFPFLSGLLLFAVFLLPAPFGRGRGYLLALLCLALALASLTGALRASTRDFVILQLAHHFGLAAYAASVWRLLSLRPDLRKWFFAVVVFTALSTVVYGFHQHFAGFQQTRDFVYRQELDSGMEVSSLFASKLRETRVTATFAICNSFAGYLILVIPLCAVLVWRSRRMARGALLSLASLSYLTLVMGDVSGSMILAYSLGLFAVLAFCVWQFPPAYEFFIQRGTAILITLLLLTVLLLTRSRAGFLAFGLSFIFCSMVLPLPRRWRLLCLFLTLFGVFGGLMMINAGRDLGSLTVRLDYFRVAWQLFTENIFCGTGWGDFFHRYTELKNFPGTEAPHTPHNLVLSFFSQAGLAAGVLSVFFLAFPLWLIYDRRGGVSRSDLLKPLNIAIILGWFAWAAHSLVDLNLQVAGSAAIAILLVFCLDLPDIRESLVNEDSGGVFRSRGRLFAWYLMGIPVAFLAVYLGFTRSRGEAAYQELANLCQPYFMSEDELRRISVTRVDDALRVCRERMPYSPFPWRMAANFAKSREHWPIVVRFYGEAVARSPERASFHYHLGVAHAHCGNLDAAVKSLREASRLFPNEIKYAELADELEREVGFGPLRRELDE